MAKLAKANIIPTSLGLHKVFNRANRFIVKYFSLFFVEFVQKVFDVFCDDSISVKFSWLQPRVVLRRAEHDGLASLERKIKNIMQVGRAVVVSVLALYAGNLCSNPAFVLLQLLLCKNCRKRQNLNTKKRPGMSSFKIVIGQIFTAINDQTIYSYPTKGKYKQQATNQ